MIENNDNHTNSLYVKKKVMVNHKSKALELDDDLLSLQSTPIDIIEEEKTITDNESQSAYQKPKNRNRISQYEIENIRSFGHGENFRNVIKGLMKKRTDSTYIRGRFKPELYNRDFIYYFNLHKYIIMLRKSQLKAIIYQKSPSSATHYSYGFLNQSFGETSIDNNTNTITSNNLNFSLNPKKNEVSTASLSKLLTKIPNKLKGDNRRLDIAYTKAKDAARVVRRLEYSYNMKINLMYSKPIHKAKAQIIQKWWRKQANEINQTVFALKIQRIFRGFLTRMAFKQTLRFIQYLPFLSLLHRKFYDKLNQIAFDNLFFKFGMKTLRGIIIPKANLLVRKVRTYLTNRYVTLPKVYLLKCSFNKHVFDWYTLRLLQKLQGRIKIFLMKNNERIMLFHANRIHPYLYFYLKYHTKMYKRKIVSFRRCYQRLRELNLQVNKGLENIFEFLPYIMRKIYWKIFKKLDQKAKKRGRNYLYKKKLMKRAFYRNDKKNLSNSFTHWKIYNSVHKRFIHPFQGTLLKIMAKTLQSKINTSSSVFLSKMKFFTYKRPTKKEAIINVLAIKRELTPSRNVYMNKYFQLWRKNAARVILTKSCRKINRFLNSTKRKYRVSKAIKHFFVHGLVRTADFYKKAALIKMKLRKNLSRHVFTKIRSILFKQRIESLFKSMVHPLKDRFHQWSFENRKYKHATKDYIVSLKGRVLSKKKHNKLCSIYNHLKTRLTYHHLRKGFLKYRIKSGVYYRHPKCFNLQLLFFNKKKKQISNMKYRLLRYTVNKITIGQEDLRLNRRFIKIWDLWNRLIAKFKLKKFLKKKCKRITAVKTLLKRNKMMYWKKLNKLLNNSTRQTKGKERSLITKKK